MPLDSVTSVNRRLASPFPLTLPLVIPEQPAAEWLFRLHECLLHRLRPEHPSLWHEHVEVAVVVVVEERNAGRHHLGIQEVAGHPVEVRHPQPTRFGGIGEPGRR